MRPGDTYRIELLSHGHSRSPRFARPIALVGCSRSIMLPNSIHAKRLMSKAVYLRLWLRRRGTLALILALNHLAPLLEHLLHIGDLLPRCLG